MKGSRTRLRKVLPEREREEAAVPEAIKRLISRGPPAGSGIPFEAWRSWHRYGSLPVRPSSLMMTSFAGSFLARASDVAIWQAVGRFPAESYSLPILLFPLQPLRPFLRTLATPEPIKDWSLTSLKEKLIKIGAKVVSHGRYVVFQMAEVAIPRQMFQEILRLIAELRPQPPPAPA
jgi:hypothetical protein